MINSRIEEGVGFAKRLRLSHSIVQAPMILQESLVPLAAAVSNAGALGSLGCAEMSIDELEQSISKLRAATNGPFNLNFFLHDRPQYSQEKDRNAQESVKPFFDKLGLEIPNEATVSEAKCFDEARLSVLLETRPAMVSFHFGCPRASVLDRLKSEGIVTAATATTVQEAIKLDAAGVDVVVAQGWEAGGHRGAFNVEDVDVGVGTLALVPQVVDAVSCYVLASGGVGDGRGIAACRALGADGVWMGTAFLTCAEAPTSKPHRAAILSAQVEDTHLSPAFSGRPCRARKTSYSMTVARDRSVLPDFPLMYNYSSPIKRYGIENDDLDSQFLLFGQAAGLNVELTASQLLNKLSSDFNRAVTGLCHDRNSGIA